MMSSEALLEAVNDFDQAIASLNVLAMKYEPEPGSPMTRALHSTMVSTIDNLEGIRNELWSRYGRALEKEKKEREQG